MAWLLASDIHRKEVAEDREKKQKEENNVATRCAIILPQRGLLQLPHAEQPVPPMK